MKLTYVQFNALLFGADELNEYKPLSASLHYFNHVFPIQTFMQTRHAARK
jgi:hypothetical protein